MTRRIKPFAGQTALVAIALKEFFHVWRDRRILVLIVFLPPIFTILLGHAFEEGSLKDVPAILLDKDHSKESEKFSSLVRSKDVFLWRQPKEFAHDRIDLADNKLEADGG